MITNSLSYVSGIANSQVSPTFTPSVALSGGSSSAQASASSFLGGGSSRPGSGSNSATSMRMVSVVVIMEPSSYAR